jgi:hypothetical protein
VYAEKKNAALTYQNFHRAGLSSVLLRQKPFWNILV